MLNGYLVVTTCNYEHYVHVGYRKRIHCGQLRYVEVGLVYSGESRGVRAVVSRWLRVWSLYMYKAT